MRDRPEERYINVSYITVWRTGLQNGAPEIVDIRDLMVTAAAFVLKSISN